MQKGKTTSFWNKGLNWLANHTYRQIPAIIATYSIKNAHSRSLCFQDYISSPQLATQAGLMCVRQIKMDFIKRKQGIQKAIADFKSKTSQITQKPHEFQCPICLEMINGPVTTSCSHTFCHMCLDQAILFNATCPVCRTQIRGEEMIVSKSIERLIQMFITKFELEQVEKFVKKELQYENWIKRRSIKKKDIDIGDCIDVRDTEFIWCRATIKEIFPADCVSKSEREAVLVHYEGWANVFNEMIPLESQRLAQYKFYTSRIQIQHYNLSADNNEHLRSPVIIGEYIPPLRNLDDSSSFEFHSDPDSSVLSQNTLARLRYNQQHRSISQLENTLLNIQYDNFAVFQPNYMQNDPPRLLSLTDHSYIQPSIGLDMSFGRDLAYNHDQRNSFSFRLHRQLNVRRANIQNLSNEYEVNRFQSQLDMSFPIHQPTERFGHIRYANMDRAVRDYDESTNMNFNEQQIWRPFDSLLNANPYHIDMSIEYEQKNMAVLNRNFADPMQLYYWPDPNLRNQHSNNLQNQALLENQHSSISLSSFQLSSTHNNFLNVQRPKLNLELNPLNSSQSFHLKSQENSNPNQSKQMHFKSPYLSRNLPFVVDIEAIHTNQVAQEIKQLQRQHKKLFHQIQSKEKSVQQDMQKWQELNQMINNYYDDMENPERDVGDQFLLENCFNQNFELNCLSKPQTIQNHMEHSLIHVLEMMEQSDHQNQQSQKFESEQPKLYEKNHLENQQNLTQLQQQ